jgi:hypothetical protein
LSAKGLDELKPRFGEFVEVNGLFCDPWLRQLLDASPSRRCVDVVGACSLVRQTAGESEHLVEGTLKAAGKQIPFCGRGGVQEPGQEGLADGVECS